MQMTVERVSYLHENELIDYMNEIKHTFRPDNTDDAETVQEAVKLVRSGAVKSYSYNSSEKKITAVIYDDDAKINVDLSFGKMSAICSCGSKSWCKHCAAVVFHLYLQAHSLTDWLHEWRITQSEQILFKISDRTPEAWNDVLSRMMNPIRIIGLMENPAVFIHKFSLIEQKATPLIPFEWEWKPLFDIFYRIHALEAAWPYVYFHLGEDASSFSYGKWYVKNWLTDQLTKINDDVHSLASKPRLFETDPFHDELKVLVHSFMLKQDGLFEKRFRVYKMVWHYFFTDKLSREKEQALLEQEESEEAKILLAFFHLLQGRESELQTLINDVSPNDFAKWLPLAHLAEQEDQIESLAMIMRKFLPHIGDYLLEHVPLSSRPSFARKIDGLLEIADFNEDEREKMFAYYGETGVDVYADFLIERERFTEWAALMHRYRVSYDIAEAGGLKIALLNDPVAALPLLHLYAQNFIEEKNRQSYRRAVNLFKKMKAGCKKSGKHDFWNDYVTTVREKYRRLRALMEEMEKGNLYL